MIDGIFFAHTVVWPVPKRHEVFAELDVFLPLRAESVWVKFPGVCKALQ